VTIENQKRYSPLDHPAAFMVGPPNLKVKGEQMLTDFLGLGNLGNYVSRKVARKEFDWGFVSTCYATDTKLFETAISHNKYNEGKLVIVQTYQTKQEAERGHDEWLAKIITDPPKLVDVSGAGLANLIDLLSDDVNWRTKKRER
jgi:hypothetical protein